MLSFEEYQRKALTTCNRQCDIQLMTALGLAGEVGEYVEKIKKERFHNREFDRNVLIEELGDILWYVAVAADYYGVDLSVVASMNTLKLKKRFPDGFQEGPGADRTGD